MEWSPHRHDPGFHNAGKEDAGFNDHLLDYIPKGKEQTENILALLSQTILRTAYTLEPFIRHKLELQHDASQDFPNLANWVNEYRYIWNGNNGRKVTRQTKSYVLAAIIADYIWQKIQDYSIFTPAAQEDLEKIANCM